jgi:hypothetical protein
MPIESRFDDLDLREEPAQPERASEADGATYSCKYVCPTTTVQPTGAC